MEEKQKNMKETVDFIFSMALKVGNPREDLGHTINKP